MSLTSSMIVVESFPPIAPFVERGRRRNEAGSSNNGQQRRMSTTVSDGEPKPVVENREEFESGMLDAMYYLLKAHKYASELRVDVWEFAVEINFLIQLGIGANDLRWLVGSGWLDHAIEITVADGDQRTFSRGGQFIFEAKTCFVLTKRGASVARALSERYRYRANASEKRADSEDGQSQMAHEKPQWFADRQQLYLGDNLVKEFKLPSPNQITILATFEEEQWPPHVDDPLPVCPTVGQKERLRYTIKSLNKHQKIRRIRFRGDGRGEGICWELWTQETGLERNGQR